MTMQIIRAATYNVVIVFLGGWALMIAVGMIHNSWMSTLPTIEYMFSVVIVFLLRIIVTAISQSAPEVGAE